MCQLTGLYGNLPSKHWLNKQVVRVAQHQQSTNFWSAQGIEASKQGEFLIPSKTNFTILLSYIRYCLPLQEQYRFIFDLMVLFLESFNTYSNFK